MGRVALLLLASASGVAARSWGSAFVSHSRAPVSSRARSLAMTTPSMSYGTVEEGEAGTESYKQYITLDGAKISAWHDIPLKPEGAAADVFNMLTEIPKMGLAKMEVDTKAEQNCIVQDEKKGKLRFYHGPIFWNYGCLPQTWENPNENHPDLKCFGDDDPIDVVEIGSTALVPGSITPVKVLGVLAMIDDGELDWKLIAISTEDPLASELNDIADVEAKCKGVCSGIREWFRWYKTPDDKPINEFGYDEAWLNKAKAIEAIEETNGAWKGLRDGSIDAGKLWTGV